ncbi:MAG: cbb3-type cytochrome c oxidase subunit I, partial [Chloroflexi bacterium]|nr:cbb3-type cytochrome c oxidase subunit I [Chloroflexota bacterium]
MATTIAAGSYTGRTGLERGYATVLDWVTTVDHKKIGIMYIITAGVFGLVGMSFSLVIRTELAETGTIISAATYNQIFTMHGSVMIFLFLIPVTQGFMNYVVPLQIGALDMAFPRINALSYWVYLFGGILIATGFLFDGGSAA